MAKKAITLALAAAILLLTACGAAPKQAAPESDTVATLREFTDSTGRTLTLPDRITRIAITGPLSQVYILPLAGDMLVGVCEAYTAEEAKFLPDYLSAMPEIGQLYGGKGEMDLEALLAAAPDIVIDIGEPKDTIAADLTALTEQTGIPFLHIDATVKTAHEAYRTLGALLDRTEKAEELALWCEKTYEMAEALMETVDAADARKRLLYCLGDKGVNVIAQGSFHAETINLMSTNVAVVEDVVAKGTGNEVDLEQILAWDPEVILFAPDSCYADIAGDAQWQGVSAIASGNYYKTPALPYGWLSSPPAVQRYLGMLWLGALLYPEYVGYDLQTEIAHYYKLFYNCDLTDELYRELTRNALK